MEYLNEEKYQKSNEKVKKVGKILLIVGIVTLVLGIILSVVGFISFGNTSVNMIGNSSIDDEGIQNVVISSFGSIGLFAIGGLLDTLGFSLTVAGGIVMIVAHRREITAYSTQQVMPVVQEGAEKMAPTAGVVAKEITKGIKEGLKEE